MGLSVRILLYASDAASAARATEAAYRRFEEIDASMSDYNSESEVVRLLQAAESDSEPRWYPVGSDLFEVLRLSKKYHKLTGGAFDITIAPLSKLWRRARRLGRLPEPHLVEKARMLIGCDAIELDGKARSVRFLKKGIRIDLGGIAKGFAIDAAAAVLEQHGIDRYLIDAGGDLRAGFPPPGENIACRFHPASVLQGAVALQNNTGLEVFCSASDIFENRRCIHMENNAGWRIGVASFEKKNESLFDTYLTCGALAVSGDTYQFVEIDGVRYSHLFDPESGMPLTESYLVAVAALHAVDADALASALSVLGPEKGLDLIRKIPGTEAVLIKRRPVRDDD